MEESKQWLTVIQRPVVETGPCSYHDGTHLYEELIAFCELTGMEVVGL